MSRALFAKLFVPTILLFVVVVSISGGWVNFKLKAVPYLSYLTIGNNPLLKAADSDLYEASKKGKEGSRIDLSELLSGGPPKDGIPAIDNPDFDRKDTTPFPMAERILGLVVNGEARAYPYGILNWHEIVNDTVGGVPVSITYCPLCDTGIVFERVVNGRVTTFGVSGKLYQSCLVMYDRLTDSLWSQPWGLGILGMERDAVLKRLPAYKTTLGDWLKYYPDSKILSTDTGYHRRYLRYPYGSYYTDASLIFPVRNLNKLKGRVKDIFYIVWEADDRTPFNRFSGRSARFAYKDVLESGFINGKLGNRGIVAVYDKGISAVRVFESQERVVGIRGRKITLADGKEMGLGDMKEIPTTASFAFVYPAFFLE